MRKLAGYAALAGAALAASAGSAQAQQAHEAELTANIAATSNYVWRGLTQADSGPAVQGGVDYASDTFYVGAWGSSVDFNAPGTVELDLYAGFTPSIGPVSFDLGVLGYFYPQADDDGAESDFYELLAGASWTITEPLVVGASFYYSPEYYGETGEATYIEVNGAYSFSEVFAMSAAYGAQDIDTTGDYTTWNLGGTLALHGFEFDLRYHDTDITGADEEISFTVSRVL